MQQCNFTGRKWNTDTNQCVNVVARGWIEWENTINK